MTRFMICFVAGFCVSEGLHTGEVAFFLLSAALCIVDAVLEIETKDHKS